MWFWLLLSPASAYEYCGYWDDLEFNVCLQEFAGSCSSSWSDDFEDRVDGWNQVFGFNGFDTAFFGSSTVAPNNGISDVTWIDRGTANSLWGPVSSAALAVTWTYSVQTCGETLEADITFFPDNAFTLDRESAGGSTYYFGAVASHELGHAGTLGHEDNLLTLMNSVIHDPPLYGFPHGDEAQGIADHPNFFETSFSDHAVHPYAPSFSGSTSTVAPWWDAPSTANPGDWLDVGGISVGNWGTNGPQDMVLEIVLSTDGTADVFDPLVTTASWDALPTLGVLSNGVLSGTIPSVPTGTYNILAAVDPFDSVFENRTFNNTVYIGSIFIEGDGDGDGFDSSTDCDDTDPFVYPGAPEICNGIDDNCDFVLGPGEIDTDFDGWLVCEGDCDDLDSNTAPFRPELCDGLDNDCDGQIPTDEVDTDGDLWLECDGDCGPSDPSIFPGAVDICDGVDQDCDGQGELDGDSDGFLECEDCDDGRFEVYPGAPELCDGLDTACTGLIPPDELDFDADGYSTCEGDCDDLLSTRFPGAPELCDGLDNDCDGTIPTNEADDDGDGARVCGGDCDDGDDAILPGALELCDGTDSDCDGVSEVDADGDTFLDCVDCDDADAETFPGAVERCNGSDDDCDGGVPAIERDLDSDGFATCEGDCDDGNATVLPGALEVCDGLDNDCDGVLPANEADDDADTYMLCDGDCDEADPAVHPGAMEACDGLDSNCDGVSDEQDGDGDGARACVDCDDADDTVFPGAVELCNDVDDDCDGTLAAFEMDLDGDGWATCTGDCDDTNNAVFTGAVEVCDGVDNDCDGGLGPLEVDADGDAWLVCDGDCDDADSAVNPGAGEACDGVDSNCDGLGDEGDGDGDGSPACDDCDDGDPSRNPNVLEACNGIDDDCDGVVPDIEADADGDGVAICDGDCNDGDAAIHPEALEVCDGVDNNCTGESLECEDPDTGVLVEEPRKACGCDSGSPASLFAPLLALLAIRRRSFRGLPQLVGLAALWLCLVVPAHATTVEDLDVGGLIALSEVVVEGTITKIEVVPYGAAELTEITVEVRGTWRGRSRREQVFVQPGGGVLTMAGAVKYEPGVRGVFFLERVGSHLVVAGIHLGVARITETDSPLVAFPSVDGGHAVGPLVGRSPRSLEEIVRKMP